LEYIRLASLGLPFGHLVYIRFAITSVNLAPKHKVLNLNLTPKAKAQIM